MTVTSRQGVKIIKEHEIIHTPRSNSSFFGDEIETIDRGINKEPIISNNHKDLLGEILAGAFPDQSPDSEVRKMSKFFDTTEGIVHFRYPVSRHLEELRISVTAGSLEWRSLKNILLIVTLLHLDK